MNIDLTPSVDPSTPSPLLLADLREIIRRGKSQALAAVNRALTLTYWHVGQRINTEVLRGERAAYGQQVELLNLQKDNIMVAEYWTELPPKAVLEEELHTALIEIRERLAEQKHIEKS